MENNSNLKVEFFILEVVYTVLYIIADVLSGVQRMGHVSAKKNVCLEHVNKEVSSPPFLVSQGTDCAKFTGPVSVSV